MKIIPVVCSQCGGSISIEAFTTRLSCPYCGTAFIVDYDNSVSKGEFYSSGDNPIEIKMELINSTIINLSGRYNQAGGVDELATTVGIEIISALSSFLNKEYEVVITTNELGDVIYRSWSYDKIRWKDRVRFDGKTSFDKKRNDETIQKVNLGKKILTNHGFQVNEFWTEKNGSIMDVPRSMLEVITGKQNHCKTYPMSCVIQGTKRIRPQNWNNISNNSIKTRVNSLSQNDAINQIARSILVKLENMESLILSRGSEGKQTVSISVKVDGVDFNGIIYNFHHMGMENLSDNITMQAFSINLINSILKECVNDNKPIWILDKINILGNNMIFHLLHTKSYKKIYRSW